MKFLSTVVTAVLSTIFRGASSLDFTFPDDFVLGTASSNYQSEGAWNISDKAEGIADHWAHANPDAIDDASNIDVTADSYHKYKEDVQLIKNIGFDAHRLSISWARLLPNGYANYISPDGLAFYKNFLEELVAAGIKPIVTLHHLDHPQSIEDMGGWTNGLIVDLFANYARVVFRELGPMVDTFVTINEPHLFCECGYQYIPRFAIPPAKALGNYGKYLCLHNALKAHAKAWHIYNEEFRPTQGGKIGMSEACFSWQPRNASDPDDVLAAEYGFQFTCGWSMHPLFVGDYPEIMKTRIAAISEREGYPESRLPTFSDEEIRQIKGSTDFFGLNYYKVKLARLQTDREIEENPLDVGIIVESYLERKEIVAPGLRYLLRQLKQRYDDPPILITENGCHDNGEIADQERIAYFRDVLSTVLAAIKEDGCNVTGYLVWSLLDNWEFSFGYTKRFGLYKVDFNHVNRTRTPKWSVNWWKRVIESRRVQRIAMKYDATTPHRAKNGPTDYKSPAATWITVPFSLLGMLGVLVMFLQFVI